MRRVLPRLGLPLLGKELLEQSARRRTYVVRSLYATLLFGVTFAFFHKTFSESFASRTAVLGRGREIFITVVGLQFAGIYLFLPAMTCGVIAHEKERASLGLLFLTRLGPWTILFEKLLSRLVPLFGFLLLALPLLTYAYSFGGISPADIWNAVWLLALAGFQIAAISLCCSAWFRTTVGAFFWSYLIIMLLSLGPGLLIISLFLVGHPVGSTDFERSLMATGLFEHSLQFVFPFCPGLHFLAETEPGAKGGATASPWIAIPVQGLPTMLSAATAVVLARVFLVRRAFLPPRNLLLGLLRAVDRWFIWLNQNRLTRGRVVVSDTGDLPDRDPVAWRETARRSISRGRYIVRLLLAIELPVALAVALIATGYPVWMQPRLSVLCLVVWLAAVLLVAVQASSLMPGERARQTLDVLRATPLSGRAIIGQKYRAAGRLIQILWVPFLTIFVFGVTLKKMAGGYVLVELPGWSFLINPNIHFYILRSVLSVAVYLPLAAWLAFWIGLKSRSPGRAVILATAAIVAWCSIPLLLAELLTRNAPDELVRAIRMASPITILRFDEMFDARASLDWRWPAVLLNFAAYGISLAALRWWCLSRADRLLGREGR